MKKSPVIWLTGMSGSGKSALSNYIKTQLKSKGYKYKCLIIDGDSVRGLDKKQLGFGVEDVLVNNMRIAHMCNEKRKDYDFLLVPVISPYEEVYLPYGNW